MSGLNAMGELKRLGPRSQEVLARAGMDLHGFPPTHKQK